MALLDMLTNQGSSFTAFNGSTPAINPLATKQSKLHADAAGAAGYSLTGDYAMSVNTDFQSYLDGTSKPLPQPSQLDLGVSPSKYLDNPPR
jgi:hypothetical protein